MCGWQKLAVQNMICGTAQMDAAVLVIAATDGVMAQTKVACVQVKYCYKRQWDTYPMSISLSQGLLSFWVSVSAWRGHIAHVWYTN